MSKNLSLGIRLGDRTELHYLSRLSSQKTEWPKTLANIATAVSAIVAVVMVYLAIRDFNDRVEKERVANWQESVIFGAIRENPGISFPEIKVRYLNAAQQLALPLPTDARQDREIDRAILKLLRDRTIVALPGGRYIQPVADPVYGQMVSRFSDWAQYDQQTRMIYDKIVSMIEMDPGKYTAAILHQKLRSEYPNLRFETVMGIVASLRSDKLVNIEKGTRLLFSTSDMPGGK